MEKVFAYAWASGLIEFGPSYPSGALPIYSGDEKALREAVMVNARVARTSEQLLVPGIPEAANQHDALDALIYFSDRVKTTYLKRK